MTRKGFQKNSFPRGDVEDETRHHVSDWLQNCEYICRLLCLMYFMALTQSRMFSGMSRVLSHLSRLGSVLSFIWTVLRWKQIRHIGLNCLIFSFVTEEDARWLEVFHKRTQSSLLGPVQFSVFINNHKEVIKGMLLNSQAYGSRRSEYSKR